jgi:hypothetical protein
MWKISNWLTRRANSSIKQYPHKSKVGDTKESMGLLAQKNERIDDDASGFSGTALRQNSNESRRKIRLERVEREEVLNNHWIQPLPLHQPAAQRNDLDVRPP